MSENAIALPGRQSGGRRPRFTNDQRRRLAARGKPLGRRILQQMATILPPAGSDRVGVSCGKAPDGEGRWAYA